MSHTSVHLRAREMREGDDEREMKRGEMIKRHKDDGCAHVRWACMLTLCVLRKGGHEIKRRQRSMAHKERNDAATSLKSKQ